MILNTQITYIQANWDAVSLLSSDYRHVITDVSQVTYVKNHISISSSKHSEKTDNSHPGVNHNE